MMHRLFIINNFGEYQEGQTKDEIALHDGIDIVVAANGTRVYAVDSGYVKAINSAVDGYKHIIIGDTRGSLPGNCWVYAHTDSFQYAVGAHVSQGAFIAVIRFNGLPHVHLNRGYLVSGSWDNWSDMSFVQPDGFFDFEDTEPPVIESPFYYYRNNTDSLFARSGLPVIAGDVDIVAGMRDPGAYAHSRDAGIIDPGYGDRLCVSRVEYELSRQGGVTERRTSFDFSKLVCRSDTDRDRRAQTVFKYRPGVNPPPPDATTVFSYYIVTNADPAGPTGDVRVGGSDFAWNTAAHDTQGNPRYPDGVYRITIKAYDAHGNSSTGVDSVIVKNSP
jgi:hypothetical protein